MSHFVCLGYKYSPISLSSIPIKDLKSSISTLLFFWSLPCQDKPRSLHVINLCFILPCGGSRTQTYARGQKWGITADAPEVLGDFCPVATVALIAKVCHTFRHMWKLVASWYGVSYSGAASGRGRKSSGWWRWTSHSSPFPHLWAIDSANKVLDNVQVPGMHINNSFIFEDFWKWRRITTLVLIMVHSSIFPIY